MAFETGVVVFFRAMDGHNLARSIHPNGRQVEIGYRDGHNNDYVIRDEQNELIGIYPREWVACILPLQTQGPGANASDQQGQLDNSSSPASRDPKTLS